MITGRATRFAALAGGAAMLVAASNLGYSTSFLIVRPDNPDSGGTAASLFLLLGGLLAVPALLGLYARVRERDADLARLALVLGLVGALGAAIHGGYDLANAVQEPANPIPDLPSQIDPRGLLTFGVAALGLLAFAAVLWDGAVLPRGLGRLAAVLGALLVVVYLGRLLILDAHSAAIVVPAALAGFVASPAWYAWLGISLRRPHPPGGR